MAVSLPPPPDPTLNTPCEASRIQYCKRFDMNGSLLCDMEVVNSNMFFSYSNMQGTGTGLYTGPPNFLLPQSIPGQTILRLNPIPDRQYLLCISWSLATVPFFTYMNSVTNLMLMYYPRAIECLIGMMYADFYKDTVGFQKYAYELYGDNDGAIRAGQKSCGIIGSMQRDTEEKYRQQNEELAWTESSRSAVGRGGSYRRSPLDPYYSSPTPY